MSILPQVARMIVKEYLHRPIIGDVVLIGRQSVLLSEKEALDLIRSEGLIPLPSYIREVDGTTRDRGGITDRAFFSMFTDAKVIALDVSPYEGAEIVHDLNVPLPEKYYGTADFIFNGSCMDNLFDPANAIKCMSKMLKPKGRVMHIEHGTPVNNAMLSYSPEWFFGYYAINDYADCRIYICAFGSSTVNPWRVYRWLPFTEKLFYSPNNMGVGDFYNMVIADKGLTGTDDKTPIQLLYIPLQQPNGSELAYVTKHRQYIERQEPFHFRKMPTGLGSVIKGVTKAIAKRVLFAFGLRVRVGPKKKYITERIEPSLGYL